MDQSEIKATARVAAVETLGADKLAQIVRDAYAADQREAREPDYEARDAKRRRDQVASEDAYNCPRGEFR